LYSGIMEDAHDQAVQGRGGPRTQCWGKDRRLLDAGRTDGRQQVVPPHPDDAGADSAGAGRYGASADYQTLCRQVGITVAAA